MRVLHLWFCSYTLLTGSRALYSAGDGKKSTEQRMGTGGRRNLFALRKKEIGALRGRQLLRPCRLASGLPLRETLPFGTQERNRRSSDPPREQMDVSVQRLAVASQKSTCPGVTGVLPPEFA